MTKTDREQIQELMATYANAIDVKDYDTVVACFLPDAAVEYFGYGQPLTGHSAILAHMKRALDTLDGTQHLFANFLIDIDGDTARLRCDILAQHWRRGVPGGETYMAGGKYTVELRRKAGRWQFARLNARSLWSEGNRSLLPSA